MELLNSIGIEKDFGVFMPLLAAGCPCPVSQQTILLTTSNNQDEFCVNLYQGERRKALENRLLGTLVLPEITKARRMSIKAELTLQATFDSLRASLSETVSGKCVNVEMPLLTESIKELTEDEKREDLLFIGQAEEFFNAHRLVEDTEILLNRIMAKVSHELLDDMSVLIFNLRKAVAARKHSGMINILNAIDECSFEFGQFCSLYGNSE